jgi:hypothetical protein
MAGTTAPLSVAPVTTVTVAGGNLFRVALEQLGDCTQWNRIAKLNGLQDPWLTGLVTLKIPPVDANAGGGILGAQ